MFQSWDHKPFVERVPRLRWWRHQMETFSALLAICAGNSPASGEFPAQRPVTRSFDVFFDLCLNKRLRKQSWGWWFETLSSPLRRHCNEQPHDQQKLIMAYPTGTRRNDNVIMTSKRRRDVVLTSLWRYFCVVCQLGCVMVIYPTDVKSCWLCFGRKLSRPGV